MSAPDLDSLLTVEEAAGWLRIAPRTLLAQTRAGRVPAVRVNSRVIRFHPRTLLAALGDASPLRRRGKGGAA